MLLRRLDPRFRVNNRIQVQGLFVVFTHEFQVIDLNILNNKLESHQGVDFFVTLYE